MKKLRAYLELVRVPNTFTAMTDAVAGYWLVMAELRFDARLACLVSASALLYAGGIVSNDLADVEVDRRERVERPLPSGRVSKRAAVVLTVVLLLSGVALAFGVGFLGDSGVAGAEFTVRFRPGLVSLGIVAAVLAYNFVLKGTLFGPLVMGLCRGLNLLMALSVGWWLSGDLMLVAILAMTHYVASLTYFGAHEAGRSGRLRLVTGGIGVTTAILLLGLLVAGRSILVNDEIHGSVLVVLWLSLLIHVVRRVYRAVKNPTPQQVQYAMKTFILGIIAFDATIAGSAVGWVGAAVVLAFLLPTIVLGRWVYST